MTSLPANHLYRLTYEAFAQLSSALTGMRTLEEIAQCLEKRVKYIFNYELLRISFRYKEEWMHIQIGKGNKSLKSSCEPHLLKHEKQLRKRGIPNVWVIKEHEDIASDLGLDPASNASIWGWHFKTNENRDITLSLMTTAEQNFSSKNVPLVKLFIEILESKLTEIALFKELADKNSYIEASLKIIEEKNREIELIMNKQEEVIKTQTSTLKKRNEQLMEVSVLNAHSVREPLSRILGLTKLIPDVNDKEVREVILPMLQKSSEELDVALKEVIDLALNDIEIFKNFA